MITYGFFNSENGDRTYTADDFNKFFSGLIPENGVFESVGEALKVTYGGSGLRVAVGSGKALVNSHWVHVSEAEYITLATADLALDRWDKIVLRYSEPNRTVSLQVITGTPSASKPASASAVTRNATTYDILLAVIRVPKAASTINQSYITDMRANTSVCGFVTGLIKQVDTTELFNQYQTAYEKQLDEMDAWFKQQQATFNSWYSSLTETLNVDTKIVRTTASPEMMLNVDDEVAAIFVPVEELGYTSPNDILDVFVGGVYLAPNVDYTLELTTDTNGNVTAAEARLISKMRNIEKEDVTLILTKSVIGH